jgi:hypothetical protein
VSASANGASFWARDVDLAQTYGLAERDRESRVPARFVADVELGGNAGLVVAERLQGAANALGRAAVLLLDAPARRVACLVVEVEIREHVGCDRVFDAVEHDVRRGRARREQRQRQHRTVARAHGAPVPAGRSLGLGCRGCLQSPFGKVLDP